MQHRLGTADVIRDVFGVGGAGDAGGQVEARDLQADAVALPEQIGRRHDLDCVFGDLAGNDGLARRARELVPRLPRLRALRIERAIRRLEPRVTSRSARPGGSSRSPSRTDMTDTSGPTSLRMTIQLVSSWSISANRFSTLGPAISTSCGSGSLR